MSISNFACDSARYLLYVIIIHFTSFISDCFSAAFFVERLAELFDQLHRGEHRYGQGKECANVVALFAHLYNFKVSFIQGSAIFLFNERTFWDTESIFCDTGRPDFKQILKVCLICTSASEGE